MTERFIPSGDEMAATVRDAELWRAGLSQSKIASAVMGVPGMWARTLNVLAVFVTALFVPHDFDAQRTAFLVLDIVLIALCGYCAVTA